MDEMDKIAYDFLSDVLSSMDDWDELEEKYKTKRDKDNREKER